ncbi:host attachment protein [Deltaproteobacteria bacterium]|nr:host attachment protein [Deltaproteobacteria bacterium]
MTWMLILNASYASFYHERADGSIELLRTLEHPSGRARGRDLGSDRPGRSTKGPGGPRTAFEPHTDPVDVDRDHLVREVVAVLEAAVVGGECAHIVLVAPPRLLGRLRKQLPTTVARCVVESITLDLAHKAARDIPAALRTARAAVRPAADDESAATPA